MTVSIAWISFDSFSGSWRPLKDVFHSLERNVKHYYQEQYVLAILELQIQKVEKAQTTIQK